MAARNRLRIIGGEWRGQRLPFAAVSGLRPTADRTRETLFNWLQGEVTGARCLDLFAGSGALGLEALSRGAREVVLVDRSRAAIRVLEENVHRLGAAGRVRVVNRDAMRFLAGPVRPFDLVFLDPPFRSDIIGTVCAELATGGWLAPGSRIYLEVDRRRGLPALPEDWRIVREGRTGDVAFALAAREGRRSAAGAG